MSDIHGSEWSASHHLHTMLLYADQQCLAPTSLALSQASHDALLDEVGKPGERIVRYRGLPVTVDPSLPPNMARLGVDGR